MGCCGKSNPAPSIDTDRPPQVMATPPPRSAQYFEYVGKTGLTAFGPVTGRRYRFAHPGARLPVDERDAPSMAGVPNLRKSPAPE